LRVKGTVHINEVMYGMMSVTYVREFQGMWPIRTTEGGHGMDFYPGQWEM